MLQRNYIYTINETVDADLAGTPAKLVLMFEEGSAMEVDVKDVIPLQTTLNVADSPYINIEYNEGRNSCDCYGEVSQAIAFNITCYEPEDDMLWEGHNHETDKPFSSWKETLAYFLEQYCERIEMIEAIYEGDKNA